MRNARELRSYMLRRIDARHSAPINTTYRLLHEEAVGIYQETSSAGFLLCLLLTEGALCIHVDLTAALAQIVLG